MTIFTVTRKENGECKRAGFSTFSEAHKYATELFLQMEEDYRFDSTEYTQRLKEGPLVVRMDWRGFDKEGNTIAAVTLNRVD